MKKSILIILILFILFNTLSFVSAEKLNNSVQTSSELNEIKSLEIQLNPDNSLKENENTYLNKNISQYSTNKENTSIKFDSEEKIDSNQYNHTRNNHQEINKTKEEDSNIAESNKTTIQSQIDNANPQDTVYIKHGTYNEDLTISKPINLIAEGTVILKSTNIGFNILYTANKTTINGFTIIISNNSGIGIRVNGSDCTIINNKIIGGNIGIEAGKLEIIQNETENKTIPIKTITADNITITQNQISNISENGIIVKGYNPKINNNIVSNIMNNKEDIIVKGFDIQGIALDNGELIVIVSNNTVYNLESKFNTSEGFDISINGINANIENLIFKDNTIYNISGGIQSIGANIQLVLINGSLNNNISINNNNIYNMSSTKENSTIKGMTISITSLEGNKSTDSGVLLVNNNKINELQSTNSGTKITGLEVIETSSGKLVISNNLIEKISSKESITGISSTGVDYSNFKSMINITNNTIRNMSSQKINGIIATSLGKLNINHNILNNLLGNNSTYLKTMALNINLEYYNISIPENATIEEIIKALNELKEKFNNSDFKNNASILIYGNNLEGNGKETAISSATESTINYNRIVNFQTNILKPNTKEYILESYGINPNTTMVDIVYDYLKNQEDTKNLTEEELRNISESLGNLLDQFLESIDNFTKGNINAKYNWWGTNSIPDKNKFLSKNGNISYNPWLILTINSNPKVINKGTNSLITVNIYTDSNNINHQKNSNKFFNGPNIIITTNLGSLNGEKLIKLNWTYGRAEIYLYGIQSGLATIKAIDYETVSTNVLILGNSIKPLENNKISKTNSTNKLENKTEKSYKNGINMLNTGNPLTILLTTLIILISFIGLPKRK